MNESNRGNPLRRAIQAVLGAPEYSPTETPAMRRRDATLEDMVTHLDEAVATSARVVYEKPPLSLYQMRRMAL
jgi:hypothetical protein